MHPPILSLDPLMPAGRNAWEADEHPHLGNAEDHSRGNGVLLWFVPNA
jgi:hypothetical protein